jgi:hypothetical protein
MNPRHWLLVGIGAAGVLSAAEVTEGDRWNHGLNYDPAVENPHATYYRERSVWSTVGAWRDAERSAPGLRGARTPDQGGGRVDVRYEQWDDRWAAQTPLQGNPVDHPFLGDGPGYRASHLQPHDRLALWYQQNLGLRYVNLEIGLAWDLWDDRGGWDDGLVSPSVGVAIPLLRDRRHSLSLHVGGLIDPDHGVGDTDNLLGGNGWGAVADLRYALTWDRVWCGVEGGVRWVPHARYTIDGNWYQPVPDADGDFTDALGRTLPTTPRSELTLDMGYLDAQLSLGASYRFYEAWRVGVSGLVGQRRWAGPTVAAFDYGRWNDPSLNSVLEPGYWAIATSAYAYPYRTTWANRLQGFAWTSVEPVRWWSCWGGLGIDMAARGLAGPSPRPLIQAGMCWAW